MSTQINRYKKYRRTKRGFIVSIYNNQKLNSIKRNHPSPSYSLDELYEWLLNKTGFEILFNQWVKSDYNKWARPSIDRLNDYKPYTFDNIRIVTWNDNYLRSCSDRKNGFNNKQCKAILQYDINGNFIKQYHSAQFAFRETGISQGNISQVCKGARGKAGGFIWKYKKEEL